MKVISVIGLGKLGLCTACCLAKAGYRVIGMDIRRDYVETLKNRKPPFFEKGLPELLKETKDSLSFTCEIAEAVMESEVSFIIVPTPSNPDGSFSNKYVIDVLVRMADIMRKKGEYHLINVVSTVMPMSCESTFIPLLKEEKGLKEGRDFDLTYNPEFIAIGSVIRDFLNPDIVLIGERNKRAGDILEKIYRNVCENNPYIARTSLINAEIAKLAINCYCTMKISFANNLAMICDRVPGADASEITKIIGHDSRIGLKYIKPGLGFGGPCFPRDNEAFMRFASKVGGYIGLQRAVVEINSMRAKDVIEKILKLVNQHGKKLSLLGLTYKPFTYLTERSQALEIASYIGLNYPDIELRVYDPMAKEKGPWRLCDTLEECVKGANVVAILTPWPQFFESSWTNLIADGGVVINFWR